MMESLEYWHWISAGILLLVLEMLLPGAFLMWFGASAVLVGGILWLFPDMIWQWQLFLFAIFSLLSIFGWRKMREGYAEDDPDSGLLNQRGRALIGRRVTLASPIKNGVGKVQIDDTYWRVVGEDAPKGTLVEVVDAEGATLKVQIR